jgi:glucan-binding YG repeat protein
VTNDDSRAAWWAWVEIGRRFTVQNQDGQQLYVVAESGADKTGTWYYTRNAGLMIGPLTLGEVTVYDHPTADAARAAATEDYRQIARFGEWVSYMVSHKPPPA